MLSLDARMIDDRVVGGWLARLGLPRGLSLTIGPRRVFREHGRDWATATVTAGSQMRASSGGRHCVLRFRDTTDPRDPLAFTDAMAQAFVRFASTLSDDPAERVLVTCRAGVSRSPALGYGLLVAVGRSPAQAMRDVLAVCPNARPNRLVVDRLDRALGTGGAMRRELLRSPG
jgi:predicted protein tyrosine phosphatase